MPSSMAGVFLVIALASASGSACGMTPSPNSSEHCHVIGGEKLPGDTGGPQAICAAIEAAAGAPEEAYSVEVEVLSNHLLAARIRMADGQLLPERKLSVSDRKLNRRSIERFANSIGEAIRNALAE